MSSSCKPRDRAWLGGAVHRYGWAENWVSEKKIMNDRDERFLCWRTSMVVYYLSEKVSFERRPKQGFNSACG